MEINIIYNAECLKGLKSLPDESVNCCVTSPPYFNLRDYGCVGQIGLEKNPEEYISKLVHVFREVKRILKNNGTLWINIGDCYAGSMKIGYKNKDLIGIPWMLAFALRNDGWYLRQDIIWSKPSVMPESVKDRCTKSHEYIFLLSKKEKYYFDNKAISEPAVTKDSIIRDRKTTRLNNIPGRRKMKGLTTNNYENRNKRSVWRVATQPFKEAHFAVFPEKLIVDCIKAGCPPDGIVLDPFMGSGTTAVVTRKLERNYIGIELNPDYIKLANERLRREIGIFNNLTN